MIIQLNPPIPFQTPKGYATALFLSDSGYGTDLHWITFLENGECCIFGNHEIRADFEPEENDFDPDENQDGQRSNVIPFRRGRGFTDLGGADHPEPESGA